MWHDVQVQSAVNRSDQCPSGNYDVWALMCSSVECHIIAVPHAHAHTYSYKNRPPLGFDELGGEADQAFELSRGASDAVEYPVK